jgi:hypothetical protein
MITLLIFLATVYLAVIVGSWIVVALLALLGALVGSPRAIDTAYEERRAQRGSVFYRLGVWYGRRRQ